MIASYKGASPEIHPETFIASTAVIIGNVKKQLDESTSKPFQQPAKNYLIHSAGHRDIELS